MPSGFGANFGQALAQSSSGFMDTLARVLENKRRRQQQAEQNQLQRARFNLKVAQDPTLSTEEPQISMNSARISEGPSGGRFSETIRSAAQNPVGGPPTASRGSAGPSAGLTPAPDTVSSENARAIRESLTRPAPRVTPEGVQSVQHPMAPGGKLFVDPNAEERASREAFARKIRQLTSAGVPENVAPIAAEDPSLARQYLTPEKEDDPAPPWQREGFESREAYLDYLGDKERATASVKGSGNTFNPTDRQLERVGVPEDTREALESAPSSTRAETFNRYATGLEDAPGDGRVTPTFGQAQDIVNEMYQTGSRFGEPEYSLSGPARAAKADSLAQGQLGVAELAERETSGGEDLPGAETPEADTDTTSTPTPPREKVRQVVESAGGIESAIERLEQVDSPDHYQRAMLEHLRSLQKTGDTGGL